MNESASSIINVYVRPIYSDIFQDRKVFFIPKYQRPYSWERKHLEDLWNYLLFDLEQNSNTPYMISLKND